jgi:hypothetical protein
MVQGVASGSQLAFKLNRLQRSPITNEYIAALSEGDTQAEDGDERVENALEFVRQWVGHHAPRLFASLDRIQKEVFSSLGLRSGDYSLYTSRIRNLFLPPPLSAIDEYGLPVEVAERIQSALVIDGNLDHLLASLALLDAALLPVSTFERQLIEDTQATLSRIQ